MSERQREIKKYVREKSQEIFRIDHRESYTKARIEEHMKRK
jgi:hypothetical protein